MKCQEVRECLKVLRIDYTEADGLFRLLDVNENGSVNDKEMIAGCLRLKGDAQALELSLLIYEVTMMYNDLASNQASISRQVLQLSASLAAADIWPIYEEGSS